MKKELIDALNTKYSEPKYDLFKEKYIRMENTFLWDGILYVSPNGEEWYVLQPDVLYVYIKSKNLIVHKKDCESHFLLSINSKYNSIDVYEKSIIEQHREYITTVKLEDLQTMTSRLCKNNDDISFIIKMMSTYTDGAEDIAEEVIENFDMVNKPSHYKLRGLDIEAIDVIRGALTEEEFRGFCKGNVLKYTIRESHKNGDEDLKKAKKYLEFLEGE